MRDDSFLTMRDDSFLTMICVIYDTTDDSVSFARELEKQHGIW
jgi:hypothetical protein